MSSQSSGGSAAPKLLRIVSSAACLAVAAAHIIWPAVSVDWVTLVCLGILCLLTYTLPYPRSASKENGNHRFTHLVALLLLLYAVGNVVLMSAFHASLDIQAQMLLLLTALPWLQPLVSQLTGMMYRMKKNYALFFAALCLVAVILRMLVPNMPFDTTSLFLLALVLSPFILDKIKSFEVNGVGKFELFTDEEKLGLQKKMDDTLLSGDCQDAIYDNDPDFAYQVYLSTNMKMAFAGMRFALERNIRYLYNLLHPRQTSRSITAQVGLGRILNELVKKQLLDEQNKIVLLDMLSKLEKGILSKSVQADSATNKWAIDLGRVLLCNLKVQINNLEADIAHKAVFEGEAAAETTAKTESAPA